MILMSKFKNEIRRAGHGVYVRQNLENESVHNLKN